MKPFVQLAETAAPAQWVVDGLEGFGKSVTSVVPKGFEAYARVFHPAFDLDTENYPPVSWSQVAALTGRTTHKAMQWLGIAPTSDGGNADLPDGLRVQAPDEGNLPPELGQLLEPILTKHTSTPERCWFAVWDGFGSLGKDVYKAPKFEIPGRGLHLFSGSSENISVSYASKAFGPREGSSGVLIAINGPWKSWGDFVLLFRWLFDRKKLLRDLSADLEPPDDIFSQSANLMWADDRAWCVATEIDFDSTYIGGSQKLVDDLLAESRLEVYQIDATDPIGYSSETLNPMPAFPY